MKHSFVGKLLLSSAMAVSYAGLAHSQSGTTKFRTLDSIKSAQKAGTLPSGSQKGRYIVKLKSNIETQGITIDSQRSFLAGKRSQMSKKGMKVHHSLTRINSVSAELSAAEMASLIEAGDVEYIEKDPVRAIIPNVETQAIELLAESTPYGITMVQAQEVSDADISNMTVCITDTGYDGEHEDLRPYYGTNISGSDNDGNGNDTGNWYNDGHGHGTHVAGTISALGDNGIGVVGVSPSDGVGLHIVKVFNDAGDWAYGSDLIAAVEQCVAAGASVISMSLGGGAASSAEEAAFESAVAAGVLPIAAAGNDGTTGYSYPASYDSVVSVAAIDSSKSLASFSQRNSQVEIAAPGVSVLSTLPGNTYEAWSGTSMATPHVSGVAALVWSNFPSCSPTEIRSALNASAQDLGSSGRDNSYGYGLVQAKAAYDYLATYGCAGSDTGDGGNGGDNGGSTGESGSETGLSASAGEWLYFSVEIPSGTSTLEVTTSGSNGDADLYVRSGAQPTTSSFTCRSWSYSSNESCTINSPAATTWYIGVRAYSAFSGLTMSWSYE